VLDEQVVEDYLAAATAVVEPQGPRALTMVHTSLHGVGNEVVQRAFAGAGFAAPVVVPSQSEPDPAFPTVAFPNPEEPGAIDAALALAAEVGADLVLANDPDADRCAAAVPDPAAVSDANPGGWRMLRGDEVGALLGAHLLARGVDADAVFANSIVSSRLLAALARAAGVRHEETLTGFKWIARVPGLRYGYEEALGYCVDPEHVRDKDGVSALLMLCELAAATKAEGRTLTDLLDDIAVEHGLHATDQVSVRVSDLADIDRAMEQLRGNPPDQLGGLAVEQIDDLTEGSEDLPPTDGLRYRLADGARVIVRPSGTEPKVKAYLEVVVPVHPEDGVDAARISAAGRLDALGSDIRHAAGI